MPCGVTSDLGCEELIRRADNNLLRAKAAGKGKLVFDAGEAAQEHG